MAERELSVALTVLRIIRGWTQEELAKESGVRSGSISDYERGKTIPGLKTLQRLVGAMGYPLSALDQAQTFIYSLRNESILSEPSGFRAGREAPQESVASPADRALGSTAALRWEVEQVSAEAGRVVSRMTRLLFGLMSQNGLAESDRDL